MKIAVSADSFSSFTSSTPVRGMMLQLIKLRSQDTFVLFYSKKNVPLELSHFYETINSLPNVEVRYFKYPSKVVSLLRLFNLSIINDKKKEFDLFLNPGYPEYWASIHNPSICSVADLSTLKGLATGKYVWFFKIWNKFLRRSIFRKVTNIVSISEFTKNDIVDFWPEFKNKITVIPNGIDDFWFDNNYSNINVNPFGNCHYFIWWGMMSRRKNIERLLFAYKSAKNKHKNLPKLLLVGKIADYMTDIQDCFDENIKNIPFQDPYILKRLVKESCGLIFPSLYEGFGLPVIEAFSQGVPVACSNITSLPEVAGGRAILFNPEDHQDIEQAIFKLSLGEFKEMELISYAHNYTYNSAAHEYSSLIDSLSAL